MIGDSDRTVSDLYDMIHPNANDTLTVRSVFVIGPDKKIKLSLTYPVQPVEISTSCCGSSIHFNSPPIQSGNSC